MIPFIALLLPISMPIIGQVGYPSLADAEHAAMTEMQHCDPERECGLGIYKLDNAFHYTSPVSQHESTAVDYRVGLPHGATLVALMHTHPGPADMADKLSASDKNLAHVMGVPVIAYALWDNKLVTK